MRDEDEVGSIFEFSCNGEFIILLSRLNCIKMSELNIELFQYWIIFQGK